MKGPIFNTMKVVKRMTDKMIQKMDSEPILELTSFKELQSLLDNMEELVNQKIKEFISKQTEIFKLNNVKNSSSPPEQNSSSPNNSDEFDSLEETLRLVINSAEAPGRARLVIVPGEDAPERPWPVDPWFEAQGGVLEDHPQAGAQVWTFPVGLRIPAPPPLHP